MAFTFPFLKSAFTSLSGADVDVGVLRATIVNGGIIIQVLLDQPEGIRWIDEVADPTLQFSFATNLTGPEVTELNSVVAAHTGPSDVSEAVRVFFQSTTPLVTDDSDKLYALGDVWHDSSTNHSYMLTDATVGAAVWQWMSGWGQARPDELVKLRADLQTNDEAAPAGNNVLVTDGAGDFDLVGLGSTQDRGSFEDFGADTSTSSATPATRMSENPTLIAGRYEIGWTSEIDGTAMSTQPEGHFTFNGGIIDETILTAIGKFNGRIERVVTAGTRTMVLQISRDSGSGSARMRKSTMWYKWLGAT